MSFIAPSQNSLTLHCPYYLFLYECHYSLSSSPLIRTWTVSLSFSPSPSQFLSLNALVVIKLHPHSPALSLSSSTPPYFSLCCLTFLSSSLCPLSLLHPPFFFLLRIPPSLALFSSGQGGESQADYSGSLIWLTHQGIALCFAVRLQSWRATGLGLWVH